MTTQPKSLAWECSRCGCSNHWSLDGEKVCGCDSCTSQGCETHAERITRGCQPPTEVFDVLAGAYDIEIQKGSVDQAAIEEMKEYLNHYTIPVSMEYGRYEALDFLNQLLQTPQPELPTKTVFHKYASASVSASR